MIIRCDCKKEEEVGKFQDKTYGNGCRVANPTVTKSGSPVGRCTICGSERPEFKK